MIYNTLKKIREDRGMSKSELSRRSGVSRITITNIESQKTNPKATTIHSICRVLNKKPTDIFFIHPVNHELQNLKEVITSDSSTSSSEH